MDNAVKRKIHNAITKKACQMDRFFPTLSSEELICYINAYNNKFVLNSRISNSILFNKFVCEKKIVTENPNGFDKRSDNVK